MAWIGWAIAVVLLAALVWLWRKLVAERAHGAQLLYARIDAENQADALRAQQVQVMHVARTAALGSLLAETSGQLAAPLASAHADIESAKLQFADYRELVKRYDAAVQYCLQPVELIFGADKASLDQLVSHVEGARRKLFEARAVLEKSIVHGGSGLLKSTADDLRPAAALANSLHALAAPVDATGSVDIGVLLDDVLRVLQPRFGGGIRIVRDYRAVAPVVSASGRLHEAFLYLIDNATRAIDGEGSVSVSTRAAADGKVEVIVTDTGSGIADDVLPQIYEAFFTTRADGSAAGVGLTLALEIITAEGGAIAVRSTRGNGSSFTVALPALREAAATRSALAAVSH